MAKPRQTHPTFGQGKERMLEVLRERATQTVQKKTSLPTGYSDLVQAGRPRVKQGLGSTASTPQNIATPPLQDSLEQSANRVAAEWAPDGPLTGKAAGAQGARSNSTDLRSSGWREPFESQFGFDFGRVRIHADASAGTFSEMLGADAVTHGRDIYFAPGRFHPESTDGQRLIAHELTHVVQQGEARSLPATETESPKQSFSSLHQAAPPGAVLPGPHSTHHGAGAPDWPALQPKLKITGKAGDISRTITLLNSGLFQYTVSIDKSGNLSISPNKDVGPPSPEQQALASRLTTVIDDSKDVIMTVSSGSKTLVGSWATADFDIADVEKIGVGALIHEIVEQHQKQAMGVKDYGTATTGAHGEASKAESEVTGLTRGADKVISMKQNTDGTVDAVIETSYTSRDGTVKTMVSKIQSNNIVSVTWK